MGRELEDGAGGEQSRGGLKERRAKEYIWHE